MLGNAEPNATVAVRDLTAAARFYEDVLGLTRSHTEGEEAIEYQAGAAKLLVYRSQFAGTSKATVVTWVLGDRVDHTVRDLKGKGVRFERYDMPDTSHEGDVHVGGDLRVAWFKDPDGNIHSLVSR
jgi:catechol 2,3-dioxygenase-like lactoylglutathione lyase family enzyme